MQTQCFDLFADYFQFYLWDEVMAPGAPTGYPEADVACRLKAAPHVVRRQNESKPPIVELVRIFIRWYLRG